ncbi:Alpha/Beta hydrolase protein [Cladochytrium replicatum]|nr:Alpha/Beta hydrolase protein [Cladochytrium replicatum]
MAASTVAPPTFERVLRTPEERFQRVAKEFPYSPKYLQWGSLRMAYVDEHGPLITPAEAKTKPVIEETWLLLHGNPTWSYLYRKMIPELLSGNTGRPSEVTPGSAVRRRIVAPDLFGFGRSDKPCDVGNRYAKDTSPYTYTFHRDSLRHFVLSLNLTNITLVCQDWGGLLGLTLPHEFPDRFKRIVIMDTSLPLAPKEGVVSPGFQAWKDYNNRTPDMDVAALMSRSVVNLSKEEAAAYLAPYPDVSYKAGIRAFVNIVPADPTYDGVQHGRAAAAFLTSPASAHLQIFVGVGLDDPVINPQMMRRLVSMLLSVKGRRIAIVEMPGTRHFVQEDAGREVVWRALDFFEAWMDSLETSLRLLGQTAAALFTGASIYINVVDHPARMDLVPQLALQQFRVSFWRAARMQSFLAAVAAGASGALVYVTGNSIYWIPVTTFSTVVVYTLSFMMPLNLRMISAAENAEKLMIDPASPQAKRSDVVSDDEATGMLVRWNRLHLVRSALSFVGLFALLAT